MSILKANIHKKTLLDVDVDELIALGIRAIIFDIDNTLAEYNCDEPIPGAVEWVKNAESKGLKCCMISNNRKERVQRFNRHFNFFTEHRAAKPLNFKFIRAARRMGVKCSEVCVIGDQIFSEIMAGNSCGMYTVLVDVLSDVSEGWFCDFKRWLEKFVIDR